MKVNTIKILIISIIISTYSCKIKKEPESMDEETWKTGWRMIENSWDENYSLAEMQFDSLLTMNKPLDERFLINGLEIKVKLSKEEDVPRIIEKQPDEMISKICEHQFVKSLKPCTGRPKEKVENEELQLEIIKLYVADQAIRGNVMKDVILKYQIDSTKIKTEYDWTNPDEIDIDEINRNRLKEIFKDFGFPTRKLIGKDAMNGIFLIIQHADGDKEWQKSQLPNIELAVKRGDFTKQRYAYVYDRIKVNSNQQQRYGSQFAKVDKKNNIAELRDTEDLANLDQRRREMGLMPIDMYKRLMLMYD